MKRGGGAAHVSFDAVEAERRSATEPVDEASPEILYDRQWAFKSQNARIAPLIEMRGFGIAEIPGEDGDRLWLRGGFPRSFLAEDDAESLRWRRDFIGAS